MYAHYYSAEIFCFVSLDILCCVETMSSIYPNNTFYLPVTLTYNMQYFCEYISRYSINKANFPTSDTNKLSMDAECDVNLQNHKKETGNQVYTNPFL